MKSLGEYFFNFHTNHETETHKEIPSVLSFLPLFRNSRKTSTLPFQLLRLVVSHHIFL